ncbi:MAG: F0F1 ATP synthase subunit B [Mariniblastus sp.]|nr:F0F1 ATP synthase subunit B [Mariniblastus sp.]
MITTHNKKTGLMSALLALCLGICTSGMAEDESGDHSAAAATSHGGDSHEGDGHGDGAHEANTNPLSVDPDLALFTALVFVLLLLVLWKMAWGPIMAGLAAREEGIASNIDQAQQDAEAAAEKLREYEEQLTAAADEVKSIVAEARRDAEVTRDKIVAEAQATAQRERERSIADIEVAKNLALDEVAKTGADLAVDLAGKIVHDELDRGKHAQLISDALSKLPSNN